MYRLEHPSLTRVVHQNQSGGEEDMMGMIGQLMQRLEENPEDVSTLRTLGQVFMRMQAWSDAQRFWTRLLALEPEDVQARQQLSMCLFRQEKYAAAVDELQRVLSLEPDNAYALFNLGILHTHYLNEREKGRAYFEQVIESPHTGPELKDQAQEQLQNSNGG
ncbi:MAG: tetratricopeptide repeat protein [Desulfovermiculus sp.]|nr:tetratricopeptide repeat protein [Desulfovermiculus sp.]